MDLKELVAQRFKYCIEVELMSYDEAMEEARKISELLDDESDLSRSA